MLPCLRLRSRCCSSTINDPLNKADLAPTSRQVRANRKSVRTTVLTYIVLLGPWTANIIQQLWICLSEHCQSTALGKKALARDLAARCYNHSRRSYGPWQIIVPHSSYSEGPDQRLPIKDARSRRRLAATCKPYSRLRPGDVTRNDVSRTPSRRAGQTHTKVPRRICLLSLKSTCNFEAGQTRSIIKSSTHA